MLNKLKIDNPSVNNTVKVKLNVLISVHDPQPPPHYHCIPAKLPEKAGSCPKRGRFSKAVEEGQYGLFIYLFPAEEG